jgi:hypothetical protein
MKGYEREKKGRCEARKDACMQGGGWQSPEGEGGGPERREQRRLQVHGGARQQVPHQPAAQEEEEVERRGQGKEDRGA